jgi:MtN3 and saliva related transmembrane protein
LQFGEIFGLIAGAITTGSFIPQVVKVYKLKSAHEISLSFTLLFISGDLLWLTYGIFINSFPIIIWNVIGAILAIALLIGKLKFGRDIR